MTTYYVSSISGDNTDGSTWAKAYANPVTALAAATGAGPHTIYCDSADSYSPATAIALDAATSGGDIRIISVNRNGSTTTGHSGYLKGYAVTVNTNNAGLTIATNRAQTLSFRGLVLSGNSGSSSNNKLDVSTGNFYTSVSFRDCTLSTPGSGTQSQMKFGATLSSSSREAQITIFDCILNTKANATNAAILVQRAHIEMSGITHTFAGTKSTTMFSFTAGVSNSLRILDSDISGFDTTSGAYFDITNLDGEVIVVNCKRSATPSLKTGTWPSNLGQLVLVNVDSADTLSLYYRETFAGTLTNDGAVYRNNGAQFNGSGISWKLVTTASCNRANPYMSPWIHVWGTETSAVNYDVEIIDDSVTDLKDIQIWTEVEWVSSASFPQGTLGRSANIEVWDAAGNDWTNSADSWTNAMSNPNPQTLRFPNPTSPGGTVTPAEVSLIRVRVVCAKASIASGLYIDPCVKITGRSNNPKVRWAPLGVIQEPVASVGGGLGNRIISAHGGLIMAGAP